METKTMKVLVVEDNPSDVRILKETFKSCPDSRFDMLYEPCLRGALKRLSEEEVDLILLDLFLPETFGLETLEKVREADPLTPIVILTSLNDEPVFQKAMELGAQICLVKERVDGDSLLRVLRYSVDRDHPRNAEEVEDLKGEPLLDALTWLEARNTHATTDQVRKREGEFDVFVDGAPVDLGEILENERVKAYFQPWVSLKKQTVLGFEGLCRGVGQDLDDLISPTTLLNLAGSRRLLKALDRVFRKKALESFAPLAQENPDLVLSLNFDASILNDDDEDFSGFISMVRERGLDPGHIAIEILGSHICGVARLKEFIQMQRKFGFLIALDHIGLGYPHLDLVAELKPDLLKTDRTLIVDIEKKYHKRETLQFMVKLAHSIGALLIAEGVETEMEAMTALKLGADMIQGFYFSEPKKTSRDILTGHRERIQEITKKFKDHLIKDIGIRNSHYRQYDQIAYLMGRDLSSATLETFSAKLYEVIQRFAEVDCLFVLNKEGLQISRTVIKDSSPYVHNVFFKAAAVGSDHSLKDYYYCLIDGGVKTYTFVSTPYLSPGTGKLCAVFSSLFKDANGTTHVLCAEVRPENSNIEIVS